MVDFTAARTALSLAVQKGHFIHQLDVGGIDEGIYVTPPEGMGINGTGKLLKLQRVLYGLKQAPGLWNQKWREVMKSLGFIMLTAENCVFIRESTWVLLYLDDIIFICPNDNDIDTVKKQLSAHLDVTDMGELHRFLGVTFTRDAEGTWLSQEGYTKAVLRRYGMEECKPMVTPMMEHGATQGLNADITAFEELHKYQEIIGSLPYSSKRTRPDISAAVGILCEYSNSPTPENWVKLKRVLRYLKGTTQFGLRIWISTEPHVAYCDADWGGCRLIESRLQGTF